MSKYNEAKIYKLWSPQGTEIYIGSTIQPLNVRLYKHKYSMNCTSKILFEKYNDIRIELIEQYPCECKKDLNLREGYYIRTIDCINRCIAGRTKKEYRKDYYENNKEYTKAQRKEYLENNKDKINERCRQYHEKNKDKINERRRQLYQEKKQAST